MPEVLTKVEYELRVTDKEYQLIMRVLAITGGVSGVKPHDGDNIASAALNKKLLENRVSTLRQILNNAEGALAKAVLV